MSVNLLLKYLPDGTLPFLKQWFADYAIHFKITRDRHSKLGDYRKLKDHSHQITINSTLEPELFFFVLTHELAHLIAFDRYGFRIAPHGEQWKNTFRIMLLESLEAYNEELRPIIFRFSKSPKANFMSGTEIVRYFRKETYEDGEYSVEDLASGEEFLYRSHRYLLKQKRKKNYLCRNLSNGKEYLFSPLVKVRKIQN